MNASSNKKGVVFLALIMAVIVAAVVFIIVSLNSDPASDSLKDDEIIATLLVLNDGNQNALATDVLLYYPVSKKSDLFIIPGNTGDIYKSLTPGSDKGRTDRIDAVYHERGIDAYNYEIGKLLGITIPFNIEISIDDFGQLTDLIGGLKVFVDKPVDIKKEIPTAETKDAAPTSETAENAEAAQGESGSEASTSIAAKSKESNVIRWLLPSGSIMLDGDKIKTFIQYRQSDEEEGDLENRRQEAMVRMLITIHENRAFFLAKKNFPYYAGKFKANVSDKILYKLFEHISSMNVEENSLAPKPLQGSIRTLPSGQTLLFPLFEGDLIKDIVKTSMNNLTNAAGESSSYRYILEVQNGTVVKGAATNATILLRGIGNYDVLPASDADRNDYEHSVIINHMQSETSEALRTLADFIKCKNIEHRPSSGSSDASGADFTIILGTDWDGRYVRGGYVNPDNIKSEEPAEGEAAPAEN